MPDNTIPDRNATNDRRDGAPGGQAGAPPKFPLYVRVLAVAYVLSLILQPIGFFLLAGAGAFLYGLRRTMDGWVLGLALCGIIWVLFWSAFRWWFRRWGRTHYPQTNGADSTTNA